MHLPSRFICLPVEAAPRRGDIKEQPSSRTSSKCTTSSLKYNIGNLQQRRETQWPYLLLKQLLAPPLEEIFV